ncbi:hypothetical protein HR060_11010 [Catenovulum sp. SM1970]|uniref:hypothetical protein n=1 Tax=Marinifaba aquimaris TaxID=2741323 RepID=UPI001572E17F|nr:hypothetical protein [Marinifaba aquimaris]NTS77389.1 hypothetical protein [Marinifaba aquimaris]
MDSIDVIELANMRLSMLKLEQSVLAKNIAGIGTPKEVNFSHVLAQLDNLSPEEKSNFVQQVNNDIELFAEFKSIDANEISADELVAESLIVSGKYKSLAEGLNRKLDLLKTAIVGNR